MIEIQDIKEIAEHYGYIEQSNQLMEECAELIQAVCKLRRAALQPENENGILAFGNLVEEIADVEIMLEQVKYLLQIPQDDIESWKVLKIQRQKERMAHGKDS